MAGLLSTFVGSAFDPPPGSVPSITIPSITVSGKTGLLLFVGYIGPFGDCITSIVRGVQSFTRQDNHSNGVDHFDCWWLMDATPGTDDIVVTFAPNAFTCEVGVSAITFPDDPAMGFSIIATSTVLHTNSTTHSILVNSLEDNALVIGGIWMGGPGNPASFTSYFKEYEVVGSETLTIQKKSPNVATPSDLAFVWTYPSPGFLYPIGVVLNTDVIQTSSPDSGGGYVAASRFNLVEPGVI